tara:strand:- start:2817 stop:3452 length:636 start_codon:yes stop_codon:yes gene_type:complete
MADFRNTPNRREGRIEKNVNKFNFDLQDIAVQNLKPKLFTVQDSEEETPPKYSYLGTPVYSNLEFPPGQYKDNEGRVINFEGIRLDSVLFDVSIEKNIIRTAINGRDGTVKQFISMGDYAINVQGVIIGQSDANNAGFEVSGTNLIPEGEIRKFNDIIKCPQEIEVVSEFLDFFDVSTVVIEGAGFSQREGFRDSVYFSAGMLSDAPIELK